jgi:hypothetical protein
MRLSRPSAPAHSGRVPYDSSGVPGDSSTRIGVAGTSPWACGIGDAKGDPAPSDRNGEPPEPAPRRPRFDVATENTHTTAKSTPETNTKTPNDPIATDTAVAHALPRTANPTIENTTAQAVVTARSKRMENWGTSMEPIMPHVSGDGKMLATAFVS